MTTDITTYIYIGTTLIASAVYYLTFKYQAKKIDILEKAIKTQSNLLEDFEKFKKLLDVDHYVKNRDLQLENQKILLTRVFETQAKTLAENIMKKTADGVIKEQVKWISAWNELSQIALSIAISQFPNKEDKAKRDAHFKENYPDNSEYFINFCDAYFSGQIPPNIPAQ